MAQDDVERTLKERGSARVYRGTLHVRRAPGRGTGIFGRLSGLQDTQPSSITARRCAGRALHYGVLPHTNAGILTYEEMERLRPVNASMGLMLETTAEIPAHATSQGNHRMSGSR